jgi:hypothetical protein
LDPKISGGKNNQIYKTERDTPKKIQKPAVLGLLRGSSYFVLGAQHSFFTARVVPLFITIHAQKRGISIAIGAI